MYAILRAEKLKTYGNIGGASAHNTRSKFTPNADPTRLELNRVVGDVDAAQSVKNRIDEIYADTDKKPRKNAVLAIELVVTASPDFFKDKSQKEINKWANAQVKFMNKTFGKDNVRQIALHLDEATPHMHFIVVPEVEGKLNCRAILGGREKLRNLQDEYARSMSEFGLERGLEGSNAVHVPPKKNNASLAADRKNVTESVNAITETVPVMTKPSEKALFGYVKEETKNTPVIMYDKALPVIDSLTNQAQSTFATREMDRRASQKLSEAHKAERRAIADQVRDIDLLEVVQALELKPDKYDKKKFSSSYCEVVIDAEKGLFNDFISGKGGKGAIDLVMHVSECDFNDALGYLRTQFGDGAATHSVMRHKEQEAANMVNLTPKQVFTPPTPEKSNLEQVRAFLTNKRKIDPVIVDHHIKNGSIYADKRGNAVFLSRDRAELVGTNPLKTFKGLCPGSNKNGLGFVAEPVKGYVAALHQHDKTDKKVALVESAIDALSYAQISGNAAMSTAGSPDSRLFDTVKDWLKQRFETIKAAFDNDDAGKSYSEQMSHAYADEPVFEGVDLPRGKDWNDDLTQVNVSDAISAFRSNNAPQNSAEDEIEYDEPER